MNTTRILAIAGVLAIVTAGCGEEPGSPDPGLASPDRLERQADGCDGLPVADDSVRVDLYEPSFADPTQVTNPLFPVATLSRVVLLGRSDGLPLRVETTLLRDTRTIDLGGQEVETLVSQYVAWLDGRIIEVALDWYAQDDAGAVWYCGEDVFNYESGRIADRDGTWLAGRDGPVAMIMPPDPLVGNVWRPENICGFVFEEVEATATGVTADGPRGPVPGALLTQELHMDGTYESKLFAPGYGEFYTGDPSGDVEAVALAIPIDALTGPAPAELEALSDGAEELFDVARRAPWEDVTETAEDMADAWLVLQSGDVPPLLEQEMDDAVSGLLAAVAAGDRAAIRQATVRVALAALDFELRHEEREEIDLDLLEVWARQLSLDREARDRDAVRGDLASIRWIKDRLPEGRRIDIDRAVKVMEGAAETGDWRAFEESIAAFRRSIALRAG